MNSRYIIIFIILTTFGLGALTAIALPQVLGNVEQPYNGAIERSSPSDTITADMIHVYKDGVAIKITNEENDDYMIKLDVKDASWATITNTNSMDPVFDAEANTIRIKIPFEQLSVGDIITYQHPTQGKIIHRIVHIDQDELGAYLVLKGDNNPTNDPIKVRPEMVLGKIIAIIY